MAVPDDAGTCKGWRPLGGGIEFGESAEQALAREIREEIGQEITDPRRIAVLENLFEHHGAWGHEIVFVFDCAFADPAAYEMSFGPLSEGGVTVEIAWLPPARLGGDTPLFPKGLLDLLA